MRNVFGDGCLRVGGNAIQRFAENCFQFDREFRQSYQRQASARLQLRRCSNGVDRLRLRGDLRIDFGVGRESNEFFQLHAGRKMALDRLLVRGHVAAADLALARKAFLLGRQANPFLSDDDTIQISSLLQVYDVAGKNVLGNEHAIKHQKLWRRRAPGAIAKCRLAVVEQQLDIRRGPRTKTGTAGNNGRIIRAI